MLEELSEMYTKSKKKATGYLKDELNDMFDELTEVYANGREKAAEYLEDFSSNTIAPIIDENLVFCPKSTFDRKTLGSFEVLPKRAASGFTASGFKYLNQSEDSEENDENDEDLKRVEEDCSEDDTYATLDKNDREGDESLEMGEKSNFSFEDSKYSEDDDDEYIYGSGASGTTWESLTIEDSASSEDTYTEGSTQGSTEGNTSSSSTFCSTFEDDRDDEVEERNKENKTNVSGKVMELGNDERKNKKMQSSQVSTTNETAPTALIDNTSFAKQKANTPIKFNSFFEIDCQPDKFDTMINSSISNSSKEENKTKNDVNDKLDVVSPDRTKTDDTRDKPELVSNGNRTKFGIVDVCDQNKPVLDLFGPQFLTANATRADKFDTMINSSIISNSSKEENKTKNDVNDKLDVVSPDRTKTDDTRDKPELVSNGNRTKFGIVDVCDQNKPVLDLFGPQFLTANATRAEQEKRKLANVGVRAKPELVSNGNRTECGDLFGPQCFTTNTTKVKKENKSEAKSQEPRPHDPSDLVRENENRFEVNNPGKSDGTKLKTSVISVQQRRVLDLFAQQNFTKRRQNKSLLQDSSTEDSTVDDSTMPCFSDFADFARNDQPNVSDIGSMIKDSTLDTISCFDFADFTNFRPDALNHGSKASICNNESGCKLSEENSNGDFADFNKIDLTEDLQKNTSEKESGSESPKVEIKPILKRIQKFSPKNQKQALRFQEFPVSPVSSKNVLPLSQKLSKFQSGGCSPRSQSTYSTTQRTSCSRSSQSSRRSVQMIQKYGRILTADQVRCRLNQKARSDNQPSERKVTHMVGLGKASSKNQKPEKLSKKSSRDPSNRTSRKTRKEREVGRRSPSEKESSSVPGQITNPERDVPPRSPKKQHLARGRIQSGHFRF